MCACVREREERLSWQNLAPKAQLSVITHFSYIFIILFAGELKNI